MSTNLLYDFMDAGYRIFGLNGGNPDGTCKCGNVLCEAAYKHPVASNWQHTPAWSDESLEGFEAIGSFNTGYGVLVYAADKKENLLVVDVDARNGGVKSLDALCSELHGMDLAREAGLTVATGSGQGSMHIYFKVPSGMSLVQSHPKFKGIDFKSSGFVVGPGSMHASGNTYEILRGHPDEIGYAPTELLDLLLRPESFRADYDGSAVDITIPELEEMLRHVDFDSDRATWLNCGMALHEATGGTAFHVWDEWSAKGEKYPGRQKLANQWDRFGKSANPVRIGTLVHHAKAGGWDSMLSITPEGMEFMDDEPVAEEVIEGAPEVALPASAPETEKKLGFHPFHIKGVDLLRPPGLVGDVCQWINDRSRAPRENLAVAAALVAMSNVIGLKYTDDLDGVTANLFALCVAGSATGKEAVLQAISEIHLAAGIQRATVGSIKSEQEIIRNLIDNQAAFYLIDEFGILLKMITTSKEAYHSGVIGALMAAYSKANSFMPLTGDTKRDVRKHLKAELKQSKHIVGNNEDDDGFHSRRIPKLDRAIQSIDSGLEKPYLSLIGFTTPVTFDALVTPEQATNGFIGRSIIVAEKETNPRSKPGFKARAMPDSLRMAICGLYDNGTYDREASYRVEFYAERTPIRSTDEARTMLDQVAEWAWQKAEFHKERTGLESIPRRAREMVSKISLILAAPSGLRTAEHVRWAYTFIERDIREKTTLAYANEHEQTNPLEAIKARIQTVVDVEHGETRGVLVNRCKKWKREQVEGVIKSMIEKGYLKIVEELNTTNGRKVERIFGMAK